MLLDLVQQAAVAHVEILRGAPAIPAEGLERTLDHLRFGASLYIANNRSYADAWGRCISQLILRISRAWRVDLGFQLSGSSVCVAQDDGPCDEIPQLPQVSLPIVEKRGIHQPGRKTASKSLRHFHGGAANKLLDQIRNLLAPLAKGWNFDGENTQAIIKVLAKCLREKRVFHLNICGSQNSDIDSGGFLRPKASKLPILENVKEFRLHLHVNFANLIQKQRAAIRLFNLPARSLIAPVNAPCR